MSFTIKHNSDQVQKQFEELPERIEKAATAATAEMAKVLAERIRSMIPQKGGWFDIYRQSVNFIEINPLEYGIAGTANLPFDKVEAESSLLWFQGGDSTAQFLATYNPWTIDTIPAVKGGISADILVRPASESEVGHHRERLRHELSSIALLVNRLGSEIQENQLPVIDGRIMADLDFLTRRLEYGLGGFPRTPIWSTVEGDVQKVTDSPPITKTFQKKLEE